MAGFRDLYHERAPLNVAKVTGGIAMKALRRLWGRDVMLYVGGVSFFAILAVFPAVAILISLYSLLVAPEQAAMQAELVAHLMPAGAAALFQDELTRLVNAPHPAMSLQSVFALFIGGYASHRGLKPCWPGCRSSMMRTSRAALSVST